MNKTQPLMKTNTSFCRAVTLVTIFIFTFSQIPFGFAQGSMGLPQPGAMVSLSPAFTPAHIAGMTIDPDNPLGIDFIIETGDDQLAGDALKAESHRLISYFMSALTVPKEDMWVNLSPYEKDRIISDGLGKTAVGRDMLAQDYILKQIAASLIYPEGEVGKEFWKQVQQAAGENLDSTHMPADIFNKIWIVPDEAHIYVNDNHVLVIKNRLRVMLEEDYMALKMNAPGTQHASAAAAHSASGYFQEHHAQILRETILPIIEKEVNEGKHFAPLRQIFYSMILATWYKRNLTTGILAQTYFDQNKTAGIEIEDKNIKEDIYKQYISAFQKGVYDYIKEDYDPTVKDILPKRYFSGGVDSTNLTLVRQNSLPPDSRLFNADVDYAIVSAQVTLNSAPLADTADAAMVAVKPIEELKEAGLGESVSENRGGRIFELNDRQYSFDTPIIGDPFAELHRLAYDANPAISSVTVAADPILLGMADENITLPPISPYFAAALGENGPLEVVDNDASIAERFRQLRPGIDHTVVIVRGNGVVVTGLSAVNSVDNMRMVKENALAFLSLAITQLAVKLNVEIPERFKEVNATIGRILVEGAEPLVQPGDYENFELVIGKVAPLLQSAAQVLAQRELVNGGGGNVSYLYGGRYVVIKATGVRMLDPGEGDYIIWDLEKEDVVYGKKEPSTELTTHLEAYKALIKEKNVVNASMFHFHPPALRGVTDGGVDIAPWGQRLEYMMAAGGRELSLALAVAHQEYPVAIWGYHGHSVIAPTPDQAGRITEEIENWSINLLEEFLKGIQNRSGQTFNIEAGQIRQFYPFKFGGELTLSDMRTFSRQIIVLLENQGLDWKSYGLRPIDLQRLMEHIKARSNKPAAKRTLEGKGLGNQISERLASSGQFSHGRHLYLLKGEIGLSQFADVHRAAYEADERIRSAVLVPEGKLNVGADSPRVQYQDSENFVNVLKGASLGIDRNRAVIIEGLGVLFVGESVQAVIEGVTALVDQASLAELDLVAPGGIDLNEDGLKLTEYGQTSNIKWGPSSPTMQNIDPSSVIGAIFIINAVNPLPSIMPLLGLNESGEKLVI